MPYSKTPRPPRRESNSSDALGLAFIIVGLWVAVVIAALVLS